MKIASPSVDSATRDDRRRNLDALKVRLFAPEHRPCADCTIPCQCSKSPVCTCACTPSCPEAPARLSSDPVENPIEGRILGLVMALAKTGILTPCWSCEGHTRPDGSLHRLPQVWFYCSRCRRSRSSTRRSNRSATTGNFRPAGIRAPSPDCRARIMPSRSSRTLMPTAAPRSINCRRMPRDCQNSYPPLCAPRSRSISWSFPGGQRRAVDASTCLAAAKLRWSAEARSAAAALLSHPSRDWNQHRRG